jgi:hypothetical protein
MLPQGEFDGEVLAPYRFFNRIWKGKIVTGNTVKNKILGRVVVEGDVREDPNLPNTVFIEYRSGLTDVLTPIDLDGSSWFGRMTVGPVTVKFILKRSA